jgi:DNA-binding SARP family transcriptional activator
VQVCDLVCATRSRIGDLHGAVDVVRRRIVLRPLEESGYRTLMQLQAELGDAAAAVSTYHRCASVLERALGVTPDRSTRAVLREVMTQITPADPPRLMDEQARRRSGRGGVPLVGREHEL